MSDLSSPLPHSALPSRFLLGAPVSRPVVRHVHHEAGDVGAFDVGGVTRGAEDGREEAEAIELRREGVGILLPLPLRLLSVLVRPRLSQWYIPLQWGNSSSLGEPCNDHSSGCQTSSCSPRTIPPISPRPAALLHKHSCAVSSAACKQSCCSRALLEGGDAAEESAVRDWRHRGVVPPYDGGGGSWPGFGGVGAAVAEPEDVPGKSVGPGAL